MKNRMENLVCMRKIYDLIWAWIDPEDPQVYCNLDIDDSRVLLTFTGKRLDEPIDMEAMAKIDTLFLDGCPLDDCDASTRVYHIGNTDYKFRCATVDLIQFATEDGFVITDKGGYANVINDEDLITFIRDNPTFTISINEEGLVVVR